MPRHISRQELVWGDTYRRLAPVLRDLGIDPEAAFERLELLGTQPEDGQPSTSRLPDPDTCHCDGCGLRGRWSRR